MEDAAGLRAGRSRDLRVVVVPRFRVAMQDRIRQAGSLRSVKRFVVTGTHHLCYHDI